MQKIIPCLWFEGNAEEAVNFYTSLFKKSKSGTIKLYDDASSVPSGLPVGSVLTISFKIYGYEFLALNGGPIFKKNPSISFFTIFENEKELDQVWQKLADGGTVLMALQKYDWSDRYGWVQDRFGVSWQLSLGRKEDVGQYITPSLLFVGRQKGRAEEAVNFYTSLFDDSDITGILKYEKGEGEPENFVKHAQFTLNDEVLMAMDSSLDHPFNFSEGISLIVNCKDQKETDYFWDKFTADGGEESVCGWLKDKFGVSWQIIPKALTEMINDKDPEKSKRVMQAMLQMKKIDVKKLEEAYTGEKVY